MRKGLIVLNDIWRKYYESCKERYDEVTEAPKKIMGGKYVAPKGSPKVKRKKRGK